MTTKRNESICLYDSTICASIIASSLEDGSDHNLSNNLT